MADGAKIHDVAALVEFQAFLGRFREDLTTRCDEVRFAIPTRLGLAGRRSEHLLANRQAAGRTAFRRGSRSARDVSSESSRRRLRRLLGTTKAIGESQSEVGVVRDARQTIEGMPTRMGAIRLQALPRVAEATDLVETQIPRAEPNLQRS